MKNFYLFINFWCISHIAQSKYMEGELKTTDNWAFLARFCFLSEEGTFDFYVEFPNNQEFPNLLLYYDSNDQWPAVYKKDKTCHQKENILSIQQNQIINLTLQNPDAKCLFHLSNPTAQPETTTEKPPKSVTYIVNLSNLGNQNRPSVSTPLPTTTTSAATLFTTTTMDDDTNATIYDIDSELFGEELYEHENKTVDSVPVDIKKRSLMQQVPNYYKQNGVISCRDSRKFKSSRARWWFIAISNCDGQKGIHIKYQLLMTNGIPGDYWHEHFSADEFYVLPVLLAFTLAYVLLVFSIIICSVELKSRQLLHSTYKIFVFSVILQLSGIALISMAYLKYAVSGVLPYRTKVMGGVFTSASETIFLLLLLLLAKGYTTTRGRLRLGSSIKITIFMCLYAITYLTLFIYEAKVFDPGEVLYLYESPAGYGLIVLRIIAWWMFVYSTIFTLKHYPEKSNFYYPFNICGTLWFVAGPAFILSANSYVDKWVRESIVCGVLLFITFAGHLMFLILTLPSMANKNFPYHIRTTQIGVMQTHGQTDQFIHHAYQPTATIETVIIPLNPHADELFNGTQRAIEGPTSDDDESETETRKMDTQHMDNVLKWSTVKGYVSPIEIGYNSRMGSSRSQTESDLTNGPLSSSSPGLIFRNNGRKMSEQSISDWTKDVPVELFTISKMVINRPKTQQPQ